MTFCKATGALPYTAHTCREERAWVAVLEDPPLRQLGGGGREAGPIAARPALQGEATHPALPT